jgi:hypothetical protein
MQQKFVEYANIRKALDTHGALCVEGSFDWAREIALPKLQIDLPTVEKKAKIAIVQTKRNPIFIQLEDGTKLFFSYDEYGRIRGREPVPGSTMLVKMIRLGSDSSPLPSKISSCEVI